MADIELVIKIPEGLKKDFESEQWTALSCMEMKDALEKATPLPKGHGDLKDMNDLCNKSRYGCKGNCEYLHTCNIYGAKTIIDADKESDS